MRSGVICANFVRVLDDSETSLSSNLKVGDCETWDVRILDQIAYCVSDTRPRSHIASVILDQITYRISDTEPDHILHQKHVTRLHIASEACDQIAYCVSTNL